MIGFIEIMEDLTERKRAEQIERHIITNNADGMIVVDKNGIVCFVNPAAEDIFGRKTEELMGKSFGFPAVAGKRTEIDVVRKGGEITTAEMRVVEIEWDRKIAYLESLRDITNRKQIDQLKDEFVGTVSHELRTPLAVIKGAVELVLDEIAGPLGEEQKDTLTIAQKHICRISRIIDSLLDISKIESAKVELQRKFVYLDEVIKRVVLDFGRLAEEKRSVWIVKLPREKSTSIVTWIESAKS